MNKKFMLAIIIVVIQIIVSLVVALQLPEDIKIPTHWNMQGQIDDYSGKWEGTMMLAGINAFILLLMVFMPFYSVRYKKHPERFQKTLPSITTIIVGFFALIHLFSLLIATGKITNLVNPLFMILGLLFILLGNILPKIPANFYVGIRTPWNLSSDTNWRKTHRFGGICYVIGGTIMLIGSIFTKLNPTLNSAIFIIFITLALVPILYSFILFKQSKG